MSITLLDGWVAHAQPWATPPTMSALNYFGLGLEDGKPPIDAPFEMSINKIEQYGIYSQSLSSIVGPADKVGVRFQPVNGIFLNWMFGKVSGAATKTIVNMDGTARKPRIACWQQNGTDKYHNYAVMFGDLSLEWAQNRLMVSMIGKGQVHGLSAESPTFTFPTSIKTAFHHIESMTFGATSLNPMKIGLQAGHTLIPIPGQNGYFQELNEFAPIKGIYTLQFEATEGASLLADMRAGTKRSFVWKIAKGDDPTKYIQPTSDCLIRSCVPYRMYNNSIVWTAVLESEDFSIEVVDGVADAFYGL